MFAPIVVLLRNWLGKAKFNQVRGKAIAKHGKLITAFCNWVGIERTARQNMVRTARDNGKKLGLLA